MDQSRAYAFDELPGALPRAKLPEGLDLDAIAVDIIEQFPSFVHEKNILADGLWRDLLAFTNTYRTISSAFSIASAFRRLAQTKNPTNFRVNSALSRVTKLADDISWVDVGFSFNTNGELKGNADGIVSLVPDEMAKGRWKIWVLRTWLENYEGHGNPDKLSPSTASISGNATPSVNSLNAAGSSHLYDAIIVGAGQAGLSVAGRLTALGCSYLVVERNPEIGQNWTSRYDSLRWHTSKEYGNLPFDHTYLPEDDYLLTTKMIGSGFKRWVERFGINHVTGTTVQKARFDKSTKTWTVHVSGSSGETTLQAKNLVLSCGTYANTPWEPKWPGRENFKGMAIHGSAFRTSRAHAGTKGVVIGTANTAHDVAEDMLAAGYTSVTMVQRGHTFVMPAEWLHAAQDRDYTATTLPDLGDRLAVTFPPKIQRETTNLVVHGAISANPARFDALEAAGFKLDRYGDIYNNLYNRFGGHYVDTGASARIAAGEIKMQPAAVAGWTAAGLRLADGTELQADLVVLCTGFEHDFRPVARAIVGDAADEMEETFRLNSEGEIRGAFRRAGHPALYYTGGDIRQCRFFSRFIGLSIQANVLGVDAERYLDTPLPN